MNNGYPACHGIAVEPTELGRELGWLREPPGRSVRVEASDHVERDPDAELVFELVEPPGHGFPSVTTQTWREQDGSLWVGNTLNLSLRVDPHRGAITIAAKDRNRQVMLEGLASVALPLFAQSKGSLVLHGAAVTRNGEGILLTAVGGSGKSSLLMSLVAEGWSAVSEDQCAVDWDEHGRHRVWPGPSWVRLKQGTSPTRLVNGTAPRFEAADKRAWDIADWMAREPASLAKIVLLEQPGGDEVVWERVPPAEVVPRLARQVTWLQDRVSFPAASLPQVVRLAHEVPAYRMRIPLRPDWLDVALPLLAGS